MRNMMLTYLVSTAVYLFLDALWLGFAAKEFFSRHLGYMMDGVNLKAAALVYVLYPVGVLIFVTIPALHKGSLRRAAFMGALFGFFVYMTYDLTNYAVIRGWPGIVAAADIVWGMFVTAAVSSAGYCFGKWIGGKK